MALPITPDSRYAAHNGGTVLRSPTSDNGKTPYQTSVFRTILPAIPGRFYYHIWKGTDRLDILAQEVFQDPTKWWSILDINPEIIYPFDIPAGTFIRIPYNTTNPLSTVLQ